MSEPSNTPRTDAASGNVLDANAECHQEFCVAPDGSYVPSDFARQLERELNEAHKYVMAYETLRKACGAERLSDYVTKLQIRIASLESALRTIAHYDEESIWMDDRDDAANLMLEIAREALGE